MAPAVAAAHVYSKMFKNTPETDAYKHPKTKIRKGKHFQKELEKRRKAERQERIVRGRRKNEAILLRNLKETYPGIANIEKLSQAVNVVEDVASKKINREKVDKALQQILSHMEVHRMSPKKVKYTNGAQEKKKSKSTTQVNKKISQKKITKSSDDCVKKSKVQSIEESGVLQAAAPPVIEMELSSEDMGKEQLQWILGDVPVDSFFSNQWEKEPLLISRQDSNYYKDLMSSSLIDEILRNNFIEYTKNIDITSYIDGKRETHNPEGRAIPEAVWDYYRNGCSVRFLNPQSYNRRLHQLNASLQELFGSFVGANTYLTPAGSQGFAPHYDDIEAFILQLEGQKRWKVYKPRYPSEYLPRYSSPNFTEKDIGSPILDVILHPGDLLYLPRGYIHQASTVSTHHSLHVTISVYQKTAWVDLLEKALLKTLQAAASSDIEFRRGLPIGFLKHAGLAKQVTKSSQHQLMRKTMKQLMSKLVDVINVDEAVDAMGVQLMHDALPPVFNKEELQCSVYERGLKMKDGAVTSAEEPVGSTTRVKLIRANVCRLVEERNEDGCLEVRLYYTLDNSLEYHGKEPQFLIMPTVLKPVVQALFSRYPSFTSVDKLMKRAKVSEESIEEIVQVFQDLWERGLLMIMPGDVAQL